jgi:hypothetical protein
MACWERGGVARSAKQSTLWDCSFSKKIATVAVGSLASSFSWAGACGPTGNGEEDRRRVTVAGDSTSPSSVAASRSACGMSVVMVVATALSDP